MATTPQPNQAVTPKTNGTQAGTPQSAAAQTPTSPAAPATPVTLANVQDVIANALKAYDEQASRKLQSQLDKRDAGIIKRLKAVQGQAEQAAQTAVEAGLPKDKQAEYQARFAAQQTQAILDEAATALPEPQSTDPNPQTLDPITQQGQALYSQWGLSPSDPEHALIITNGTSQQYLDSIQQAGYRRSQRLAQAAGLVQPAAPAEPEPFNPVGAPAIGGDGLAASNNPIAKINKPEELYKRAGAKLRRPAQL